jgi:Flp pilus assembly protein TadG
MENTYCILLFLGVQSWCIHITIFECLPNGIGGGLEENEMNNIFKKIKDESGQALVIVALSTVVLFGATALSVDLGMAYNAKAELQAAADAAALAGAQDLPNANVAKQSAENYAGFNNVEAENVTAVSPYAGNSKLIEVTCTREVEYYFAKFLGFDSKVIVARAVATKEASWIGDALPFINLDDDYSNPVNNSKIVLWEKTGFSGDDEKLWPRDADIDAEYKIYNTGGVYSSVLLDSTSDHGWDGFALKSGIDNNDQKEITALANQFKVGDAVYVLSLKPSIIIKSNTDKTSYTNKQIIPVANLVLLKCTFEKYDFGANDGTHGIYLNYTGISYDFAKFVNDPDGEGFIPSLSSGGKAIIKLVE